MELQDIQLGEEAQLVYRLVERTRANVFLTGKAGTGKTTFLKYLRQHTSKRMVVLAPTGVAAINAEGMTIHSFFQLPFDPYIPGYTKKDNAFRVQKNKLNMIRSLDLVVIDEISMVRADLLDSIDDTLRRVRKNNEAFGGVQLLLIGDLQQLPPVVQPQEEELLSQYYSTHFFFGSLALQRVGLYPVELTKVYRQSDSHFVNLLNAVRDNKINSQVLSALNERYVKDFEPPKDRQYVWLTTHNFKANNINEKKMDALPGTQYLYQCQVKDTFPESLYPTDAVLRLKVGAQVMFVKNDPAKRFYNGRIGVVKELDKDEVVVEFPDGGNVKVEPMQWDNVQYVLNESTKEIEEKQLGSFVQYPLRLAWSVTIHKSQGLTFDYVMLDAANAFAAGQVYVALSRCRSLEGLVLTKPLSLSSIYADPDILRYSENNRANALQETQISAMEREFLLSNLMELFTFDGMVDSLSSLSRFFEEHLSYESLICDKLTYLKSEAWNGLQSIQPTFHRQLQNLFQSGQMEMLQERVRKAVAYYDGRLSDFVTLVPLLKITISNKEIAQRYSSIVETFVRLVRLKGATLKAAENGFELTAYMRARSKALATSEESGPQPQYYQKKQKASAAPKKPTAQVSFEMYGELKSEEKNGAQVVKEIAKKRGLVASTIYSHLGTYVSTGQLKTEELVDAEKIKQIERCIDKAGGTVKLSEIREELGESVTFEEIRMVFAQPKYKKKEQ